MTFALSVILAFFAALFLSGGTVLQWMGHERGVARGLSGWRVARDPFWWAGIGTSGAGTLCHYAALWLGMVAVVLPVSGAHLVFTAIAMARLRRSTLSRWQPVGIGLVASGVVLCLVGELHAGSVPDRFDPHFAVPLGLLGAALLALPFLGKADRFAVGSGLMFGLSAVSWKLLSLANAPVARVPVLAAFATTYVVAFLLIQAGFRRGGAATVNATSNGTATALGVVCANGLFG